MRSIPVLLICVALATSAGCFGKDDENGGDPPTNTTPTGTGTTPTSGATPTGTPTSPTAGGNTTNSPTKPAPRSVFSGTADFQRPPNADPTAPAAVTMTPFTVPAQFTTLTLNVTWTMATPAGVSGGIEIDVVDAAGTVVASCTVAQGPVQAAPAPCTQAGTVPAAGGEYSANYIGSGTIQATVEVVAS